MELYSLTIQEASALLRKREVSSRELTEAVLKRIEAVDDKVKAFLTLIPEQALKQADDADKKLQNGAEDLNPLLGIPMSLKDVVSTRGVRTTCGSKMLENFVPIFDATIAKRLFEAGAVLVGKNNMDEFAMGSSTENSGFFPTRNPWDLSTVPGGSSGGSSASVAACEGFFSIGSDTGGSIRQPAALCGVVGLKPTYGRVSRFGLIAFASSLDQLGPFTRTVYDSALVMNVIAGPDPGDSTSIKQAAPDYTKALVPNLKGMKLALPREYFIGGVEEGVERAVRNAVEKMRELGAEVEEVSMPHTKYAISTYYIIAPAEASANLARYDGIKYGYSEPASTDMWDGYFKTRGHGFGAEVKRRIMIGTYALSSGYYDAYYLKAQKVRTLIRSDFDKVFEKFDAIIAPTSPSVAFKIGDKVSDPLAMYLNDIFTIPANMAGTPGMSINCGFSNGLPVGLQILGPVLGEEKVYRVAYAYEQATEWHKQHPAI
jgi:aspartyl-tRNA(Asn)/glutamyl-tRNA(Gln) amidotransferase subunit A